MAQTVIRRKGKVAVQSMAPITSEAEPQTRQEMIRHLKDAHGRCVISSRFTLAELQDYHRRAHETRTFSHLHERT